MSRATFARVSAGALRHNAARVRETAPGARIMACVKADAYGHGLCETSRILEPEVDGFAVAFLDEALALRAAGIHKPLLILEGPQCEAELAEAAAANVWTCVCDWRQLEWLERATLPCALHCWLNIDTGMHRLGFLEREASAVMQRLQASGNCAADPVICTHFARADEEAGNGCALQLARFDRATQDLRAAQSCANSAAILGADTSHREWVRPGYMLYGGSPFADRAPEAFDLRPAMCLSAEVIALRDIPGGDAVGYGGRWVAPRPSRIATVAIGYGDGYPRHAQDGTPVRIDGRRLPLAGRVSMDMLTVDVTDHPAVAIGSRAVLWGDDPGVDEIARWADTIGYELLAALPARARRIYSD